MIGHGGRTTPLGRKGAVSATETYTIPTAYVSPASAESGPDELFRLGVPVFKLERWREKAEAALEGALKEREAATEGSALAAALRRIGELSMENELLRAKIGPSFGPAAAAVAVMARTVSPATGRRYGVARVCHVWDVPRSSFDAARHAAEDPAPVRPKGRRGPKPAVPDKELLAAIRADLDRSPWSGEGHRKIWARLRVLNGLRVARKRVLRVMREHGLLSPHRTRPRPMDAHDRRIVTEAPNVMWAIDGTQITTVQDGKVWLFATVEHCNAEALGWHVSKRGTRREALQALAMAVHGQQGHLGRDAARGVQRRHDHGRCFMADDFQHQARAWGMTAGDAFVGQPETNGVIERFFRTLKEQLVYGRIFDTLEDVRDAVRAFIARYNADWLIEKNGYLSPHDRRRQHALADLPMAA